MAEVRGIASPQLQETLEIVGVANNTESRLRCDQIAMEPLRLQPLTCKGEVAHEADGTTVGRGPQPRPNLSSPECPTRGLLQGRKPTLVWDLSSNSDSIAQRRKAKRISESKLHGIVNNNLVALLIRGSASSRVVGPSYRVVHGEQQSRRSYEQGPSWSHVAPSELGHVVRRSFAVHRERGAECPDYSRRVNGCVAGNKK